MLLEGVSEFISGPCKSNQNLVYKYRIDIYVGIFKRLITNIDSNFYELKL